MGLHYITLHYITLHSITFNSTSRTRTTSVYNASFGYSNYHIFIYYLVKLSYTLAIGAQCIALQV